MVTMDIVNVIVQRQPLCLNQLTITVWGGRNTPVHVINNAALPLANYFTAFLLGQCLNFPPLALLTAGSADASILNLTAG